MYPFVGPDIAILCHIFLDFDAVLHNSCVDMEILIGCGKVMDEEIQMNPPPKYM